jgi:hypothetical protein
MGVADDQGQDTHVGTLASGQNIVDTMHTIPALELRLGLD